MAATNFLWGSASSAIALQATGSSTLANLTAVALATADLDLRSAGNAALETDFAFRLTCQWATVTSIAAGMGIELFMVPKLDGTNVQQLDLTSGASYIPPQFRVGVFPIAKIPTASTNTVFDTFCEAGRLQPFKYTGYILNRTGQTIAINWLVDAYAFNMTNV